MLKEKILILFFVAVPVATLAAAICFMVVAAVQDPSSSVLEVGHLELSLRR